MKLMLLVPLGVVSFRGAQPRGLHRPSRLHLSSSSSSSSTTSQAPLVSRVAETLSSHFAWTVAAGAVGGVLAPSWVARHVLAGQSSVAVALSIAMFCAGSGLSTKEVAAAFASRPRALIGGVCAQFCVMPSLAKLASLPLAAEPDLAAGLVLVGCCPGGAASNVVTLLAKGDVGLSISMTASSTLCAGLLTPALVRRLCGLDANLPPDLLYTPLINNLIAPSLLGVALNETLGAAGLEGPQDALRIFTPAVSSTLIAAIVARVVAGATLAPKLAPGLTAKLGLALVFLHSFGFALGYLVATRLLRLRDAQAHRAISIEVGMQNSALAVVLATSLFPNDASRAALPGALSACCHSLMGGFLASRWSRR